MSVSPIKTINQNENGAAYEYIVENPKVPKSAIVDKLTKPTTPRSPLVDRISNAQKRRDSYLNEKKEKAVVYCDEKAKKREELEEKYKENTAQKVTERVKSAESKRKSLLDEKKAKAQAEYEKAKKVANEQAALKEEKKQKIVAKIDEKLTTAAEQKNKQLEAVKEKAAGSWEKAKVKVDERNEGKIKETAVQLEKKMSDCALNREKLIEREVMRLKEKHEKAKVVKANKKVAE